MQYFSFWLHSVWQTKNRTTIWPAIPLVGIYLEKTIILKDICTPMLIAALFAIAKTRKQPKYPSTEEWVKKMWHICTMEYYSAMRKRNRAICRDINYLPVIDLRQYTQSFASPGSSLEFGVQSLYWGSLHRLDSLTTWLNPVSQVDWYHLTQRSHLLSHGGLPGLPVPT